MPTLTASAAPRRAPKNRRRRAPSELEGLFIELIRYAFARHGVKVPASYGLREMQRIHLPSEVKTEQKAEALIFLLTERFGALSPSLQKRIRRAKPETLDFWFRGIVMAPNLTAIFRPAALKDEE